MESIYNYFTQTFDYMYDLFFLVKRANAFMVALIPYIPSYFYISVGSLVILFFALLLLDRG